MEKKEILEGNKLIAEFMGMERSEKETGEITYKGEEKGTVIWLSNLKYHTSWDWLMPVAHKAAFYVQVDNAGFKLQVEIFHALKTFDTRLIFEAVIQFIKWYNSNK